jgi:hypothetical protein
MPKETPDPVVLLLLLVVMYLFGVYGAVLWGAVSIWANSGPRREH